ncbi:MAG: hypothetical protein JOY98_01270, partial [Candidatus Eremiobacteraeota bacterium]|nr:hypothetical protein [Candidatus Eremiobacteraeota bacterium]
MPDDSARRAVQSSPHERFLKGVIKVKDFIVGPSDHVDIVGSGVKIFATDKIDIQGSVELQPDATFGFFAPTVTLSPRSFTAANTNQTGVDAISACALSIDETAVITTASGHDLYLTAGPKGNKSCEMFLFGELKAGDGLKATNAAEPGEDGGSIEIGTHNAIANANATANFSGVEWSAARPYSVVVGNPQGYGSLAAGLGGEGGAVKETLLPGLAQYRAGKGGDGGSIVIDADRYDGDGPFVLAGNGGDGGPIFQNASTSLDGVPGAPNGTSVSVTQGSGGIGGSIVITAPVIKGNKYARAGSGGNPSYIFGIHVGAGLFANSNIPGATSSGKGGSAEYEIGDYGVAGRGQTDAGYTAPRDGLYSQVQFDGATGGSATGFANPVPGSDGGSFTLKARGHHALADLQKHNLTIVLTTGFGMGGTSWGNCPSSNTPGLNGANGGLLHDGGMMALFTLNPNPFGQQVD